MPDEVKIGSLSIDIVSTSDKAVEALSKLSSALENLRKAVPSSMSGTQLSDIAKGLRSFGTKSVGNGGEQLEKLSKGLRSMSDSGVNRGVFVVQNLRDAMQGFTFSSSIATGITKMAEALEKIPTDSIEKLRSILEGFKNLQGINPESIAAAMKGMSSKTTYSQVLKESRAQQAATRSAIESWQRGVSGAGQLLLPPGNAQRMLPPPSTIAQGASESYRPFSQAFNEHQLSSPLHNWIDNAGKGFENYREQVQTSAFYTEKWTQAVEEAQDSAQNLRQTVSRPLGPTFADMPRVNGSLTGVAQTTIMDSRLNTRESLSRMHFPTSEMASFNEESSKTESIWLRITNALFAGTKACQDIGTMAAQAGKQMISAFSGMSKIGESVKKFQSKVSQFGSAIGRIVMYRAIRSMIKEIASGFKEGVTNLYQWSKATGGEFSKSMDSAASSLLYFKNSVGAAAAPLINAIVPVLHAIVQAAVAAVNAINQLFATITGASYWTKAIEYPTEYTDAVKGAGGAAKDLQKYLAPFDELNVLPSAPGGGGGGANNILDYSKMFENVELAPSEFMSKLRENIENEDWSGLGTTISTKINESVETLKTSDLGTKLGNVLSGVFQATDTFVNGIDFAGVGEAVMTQLSDTIAATDNTALGNTIGGLFMALPELIVGAIEGTDFGVVGKGFGDLVSGFFETVATSIDNIDWFQLPQTVINGVIDFFKNIDWGETLGAIMHALGSLAGAILSGIAGLFVGIWKIGEEIVAGLFNGIEDNFHPWQWILENIWYPFRDGFKAAFGIHSPSTKMEELGGFVTEGFLKGITDAWDSVKNFFTVTIPQAWEKMATTVKTKIDTFKNNVKAKFEEIAEKVSFAVHAMKENVVALYESIRNGIIEKVTAIKTRITTIFTNIKTTVENIVTGFRDAVVGFFNETRNGIIEKIQFVQTRVTSLFNGIVSFFENTFQKKWETAINAVTGFVDEHLVKPIQTAIDNIKGFWNDLKDLISKGISFPSIKLPHFKVTTEWNDTWKQNLPKIDVQWYARGGIVNQPTLIGAGEAGAEAIVPLENNTGWIRNVARELNGYNHDGTDSTATAVDEQTDALVSAIMDATARVVEEMSKHGGITLTDLTKRVTSEQSRLARAYGR